MLHPYLTPLLLNYISEGSVSISTCNWHNYTLLQQSKDHVTKKVHIHDVISGIRGIKMSHVSGFLFAVTAISARDYLFRE